LDRIQSGVVLVRSKEATHRTPGQRLAGGMGLLSENRKEEGLMLNRSLADNLTLTRYAPLSRCGFIQRRRQRQTAQEWMDRLEVRAQDPGQTVGELSGGNQQKIALGRLLHHQASVLLLDEPTRGIDVGSKAQIYKLIGQLAAQGKAIIFVSSYLPELLGVCDTIGVMCRGVLSEVRPVGQWTEHGIIAAAIGQADSRSPGVKKATRVPLNLSVPRGFRSDEPIPPPAKAFNLFHALNVAGPFFGLLLVLGLFSLSSEVRPYLFTGGNFKIILIQTVIVASARWA
jgi:ABC-type Mn2+/Zn2+ transport system ATPase subunit